MKWPIGVVATLTEQAGWKKSERPLAVAIAWASSRGDDRATIWGGGHESRTLLGLWGIPAGAIIDRTDVDPFVPSQNAALARALYVATGGSWEWSPVFRARSYEPWLTAALGAVQDPVAGVRGGEQAQTVTLAQAAEYAAERARSLIVTIQEARGRFLTPPRV